MRLKITVLQLLCFLLYGYVNAQSLYFPEASNTGWQQTDPISLGWHMQNADSLYDFLGKTNTKGFVVLKNGKIVLEKYFGTFTRDSLWYWASAGKTLTSMLTGIAQEEGFLNIDSSTSKYLGQGWTSCSSVQEEKIKVFHQLTMTSGLNDLVPDSYCTLPECLHYLSDAETRWAYHNAPYTLLDAVISNTTGVGFSTYFNSRIRNKINMDGLWIKIGYNNVFFSSALGLARYGLLLLSQGNWNGVDVINDKSYFNDMIHPSQSINPSYGYLFWLNGQAEYMLPHSQYHFMGPAFPEAPMDMYAALGKDGQILNVVPSQGIVMVRIGNAPNDETEIANIYNNNIWHYLNFVIHGPNSLNQAPSVVHDFDVYPNPADNEINIRNNNNEPFFRVSIINTNRQMVLSADNTEHINTQNLSAGVYLVVISGP
ncbi:MAG: serine hydrolase, partial [Anaerolineaceae bacterium]|nr:serine hydrolase [Anaerolineaceae bacterium]